MDAAAEAYYEMAEMIAKYEPDLKRDERMDPTRKL